MLISRVSTVASRMTIVCAMLGIGSLAWAQMEDEARGNGEEICSNRTLRGDYGYAAAGVLLNTPGLPPVTQFRSVGMTHFDGKGHLRWLERTVINGKLVNPDWTAATGTYEVNSNCTGTAVVHTPNSPVPLNLALVVVKDGKEIHTVLETDAISTVFKKVD
jgi:hypothetical protein